MPTVLLAATPAMRAAYYGDEALAGLRRLAEVRLHEGAAPLDAAGLIAAAAGAEVIVADRMTPGFSEIFGALPALTAFVRCAVDIRNVDVAAASAAGVLVTRAGPGFAAAVSELILGFMVDLARGVTDAALAFRAGRAPAVRMGRQLSGSVLGIIGYGSIGRALAPLGLALGMRVLVADPFVTPEDARLEASTLPALLATSDFVVCLAVANEATEKLMDAAAFAAMKPGAFFINAARGDLVDEAALADALDRGHLGGAAMDVGRAPDQMPNPALARRPDVIATPHVGGLTPQAIGFQALQTVQQVAAILAGEVPQGAVNADRWTRRGRIAIC
jgi:D-3-phosphoglycerate dehydrogenase